MIIKWYLQSKELAKSLKPVCQSVELVLDSNRLFFRCNTIVSLIHLVLSSSLCWKLHSDCELQRKRNIHTKPRVPNTQKAHLFLKMRKDLCILQAVTLKIINILEVPAFSKSASTFHTTQFKKCWFCTLAFNQQYYNNIQKYINVHKNQN